MDKSASGQLPFKTVFTSGVFFLPSPSAVSSVCVVTALVTLSYSCFRLALPFFKKTKQNKTRLPRQSIITEMKEATSNFLSSLAAAAAATKTT